LDLSVIDTSPGPVFLDLSVIDTSPGPVFLDLSVIDTSENPAFLDLLVIDTSENPAFLDLLVIDKIRVHTFVFSKLDGLKEGAHRPRSAVGRRKRAVAGWSPQQDGSRDRQEQVRPQD
jgi:hypothetical protein